MFKLAILCFSVAVHAADNNKVSIMTYNVENLFDLQHDVDKNGVDKLDAEFLPKALRESNPKLSALCNKSRSAKDCHNSDWNAEVLDVKLRNTATVIQQVASGKGPDILVLAEVENLNVLQMLNQKLGSASYPTVELMEGPDVRGIDNAVLSRFPLARPSKLHIVQLSGTRPTRGILDVALKINNQVVRILAVHLPSQGNPIQDRQIVLNTLQQLAADTSETAYVILAGDFNITSKENAQTNLLSNLSSDWLISMDFLKQKNFPGTSFFPPETPQYEWSFLDNILFAKSFISERATLRLDVNAFDIKNNTDVQRNQQNRPLRFNASRKTGSSDHWPVYTEFSY